MSEAKELRVRRVTQTVLKFEDFTNPFGARLRKDNKWVLRAGLIPWNELEAGLEEPRAGSGRPEIPFRIAFGALMVKELLGCSDRETVEAITENPYIQFFLGMPGFSVEPPFEASSMCHFRKRFGDDKIRKANELLVLPKRPEESAAAPAGRRGDGIAEEGADAESGERKPTHKGTMVIDASCAPEDMRYPTDLGLLNDVRTFTEALVKCLWRSGDFERRSGEKAPRTYRRMARKDFLSVVRKRKLDKGELRRGIRKQIGYCERNIKFIDSLINRCKIPTLSDKNGDRLALARKILAQQSELLKVKAANARASVSDRIVSFFKPHVRPIVRGKAAHPTEFGAKISVSVADGFAFLDRLDWNAFHEGADLRPQAESYLKRHGYWPERILCDKAYHSRENRKWCAEKGIALGAPPLGRPPVGKSEKRAQAKAARQNEVERVEVEGKFGVAKRRFSLGRVMSRLRESSECIISMVFMVMNLEKLTRLLFVLFSAAAFGIDLLCRRLVCALTDAFFPSFQPEAC